MHDNNPTNQMSNEYKASSEEHGAFFVTNANADNSILNAKTQDVGLLDNEASKHMSFHCFMDFIEINESVA